MPAQLTQFKLVFKKFTMQRIRSPVILAVEVLWPLILFLMISVVRMNTPHSKLSTCMYKERQMPSAGVIPFIQSFVCSLNNECQNKKMVSTDQEKPQDADKSAKAMAAVFDSLKAIAAPVSIPQDDEIYRNISGPPNIIDTLPASLKLLTALKDSLSQEEIKKFLNNDLDMKTFFKDPAAVKEYMISNHEMSARTADAMLDSGMNVWEFYRLLNATGMVDFSQVFCNETRLRKYIVFKNEEDIPLVRREMCPVTKGVKGSITGLVAYMESQLDFSKIFSRLSSFLNVIGDRPLAFAFSELSRFSEVILKFKSLQPFLSQGGAPFLNKIPHWLNLIGDFAQDIQDKQEVPDLTFIGSILDAVVPFIEEAVSYDPSWNEFKRAVYFANELLKWLSPLSAKWNATSLTFGQLFPAPVTTAVFLEEWLNLGENVVQTLLSARINFDQASYVLYKLANKGANTRHLLCKDPGILNMLIFPRGTNMALMKHAVSSICRFNRPKLDQELMNKFDVDKLLYQFSFYHNNTADFKLNFTELMRNGRTAILSTMKLFKDLEPYLLKLEKLSFEDMARMALIAMNFSVQGNWRTLTVKTLNGFQKIMEESQDWSEIRDLLTYLGFGADIMRGSIEKLLNAAEYLLQLFRDENAMHDIMVTVSSLGPNTTQALLDTLTDTRIMLKINDDQGFLEDLLCKPVYLRKYVNLPPGVDEYKVRRKLCQDDYIRILNRIQENFADPQLRKKNRDFLNMMNSGGPGSSSGHWHYANISRIYLDIHYIVNVAWNTSNRHIVTGWLDIIEGSFDPDSALWTAAGEKQPKNALMSKALKQGQIYAFIGAMIQSYGRSVENSEFWADNGRYLYASERMLRQFSEQTSSQLLWSGIASAITKSMVMEYTNLDNWLANVHSELSATRRDLEVLKKTDKSFDIVYDYVTYGPEILKNMVETMQSGEAEAKIFHSMPEMGNLLCDPVIFRRTFSINRVNIPVEHILTTSCNQRLLMEAIRHFVKPWNYPEAVREAKAMLDPAYDLPKPFPWLSFFRNGRIVYTKSAALAEVKMPWEIPWSRNTTTVLQVMARSLQPLVSATRAWEPWLIFGFKIISEYDSMMVKAENATGWFLFKHFIKMWADEVSFFADKFRKVEANGLRIRDIFSDSKSLGNFLLESSEASSDIVYALMETAIYPEELFRGLLTVDFDTQNFCQEFRLSDFLFFPPGYDIAKFEDLVCALNFSKIAKKYHYEPFIAAIYDQVTFFGGYRLNMTQYLAGNPKFPNPPKAYDVRIDWEKFAIDIIDMIHASIRMKGQNVTVFPELVNPVRKQWSRFVRVVRKVDYTGWTNSLTNVITLIDNATSVDPDLLTAWKTVKDVSLGSEGVMGITNAFLKNFQGDKWRISDLMLSPTIQQLYGILEDYPSAAPIILTSLMKLVAHPTSLGKLLLSPDGYVEQLCIDKKEFKEVFVIHPDSPVSYDLLQEAWCQIVNNVSATGLVNEMLENVGGVEQLVSLISLSATNSSFTPESRARANEALNYTDAVTQWVDFAKYVTKISKTKPKLDRRSLEYVNRDVWRRAWNFFEDEISGSLSSVDVYDFYPLFRFIWSLADDPLSASMRNTPSAWPTINSMNKLLPRVVDKLQWFRARNFTIEDLFADFPNLLPFVNHFERFPFLIEAAMSTLTMKPFEIFIKHVRFDSACSTGTSTEAADVIWLSKTNATVRAEVLAYWETMCTANYTAVLIELQQFATIQDHDYVFNASDYTQANLTALFFNLVEVGITIYEITYWPPVFSVPGYNWLETSAWHDLWERYTKEFTNMELGRWMETSNSFQLMVEVFDNVFVNDPDKYNWENFKMYIYASQVFTAFIEKELGIFDADYVSLVTAWPNTNLAGLLLGMSRMSDVVPALLEGWIQKINDPITAFDEMEIAILAGLNITGFCYTSDSIFQTIFPTGTSYADTVTPELMREAVCNVSTFRPTALWEELHNVPGAQEFIKMLQLFVKGRWVLSESTFDSNITKVTYNTWKTVDHIMNIAHSPPVIEVGFEGDWMNPKVWETIFKESTRKFLLQLTQITPAWMFNVITHMIRFFIDVGQNNAAQNDEPQFDEPAYGYVSYMNEMMPGLSARIRERSGELSNRYQNDEYSHKSVVPLDLMFYGFPETVKVKEALVFVPELTQMLLMTTALKPYEAISLFTEKKPLWERFERICTSDWKHLFYIPENITREATYALQLMCGINYKNLRSELSRFSGHSSTGIKKSLTADQVDWRLLSTNLIGLYDTINKFAGGKYKYNWMNKGINWVSMFHSLEAEFGDNPKAVNSIAKSIDGMLKIIDSQVTPDQLKGKEGEAWQNTKLLLSTMNLVSGLAADKTAKVEMGIHDILGLVGSPNLLKIYDVLSDSPEMLLALFGGYASSLQNPKAFFKFLSIPSTMNISMQQLCEDNLRSQEQFRLVFPVRSNSNIDPRDVRKKLCELEDFNITQLVNDFKSTSGMKEIFTLAAAVLGNSTTVNVTTDDPTFEKLSSNLLKFTKTVKTLSKSKPGPGLSPTGGDMFNMSGFDLMFTAAFQDLQHSMKTFDAKKMEKLMWYSLPLLTNALFKDHVNLSDSNNSVSTLYLVTKNFKTALEIIKVNDTQKAKLLISGAPQLQKAFKLMTVSPQLATILISTLAHKKQGRKFTKMMRTWPIMKNLLCDTRLYTWEKFLKIPKGVVINWEEVSPILCSVNLTAFSQELDNLQRLKYGPWNYTVPNDTSVLMREMFVDVYEIKTLITELYDTLVNDSRRAEWLHSSFWGQGEWVSEDAWGEASYRMADELRQGPARGQTISQVINLARIILQASLRNVKLTDDSVRVFNSLQLVLNVLELSSVVLTSPDIFAFNNEKIGSADLAAMIQLLDETPDIFHVIAFSAQKPDSISKLVRDFIDSGSNDEMRHQAWCSDFPRYRLRSYLILPDSMLNYSIPSLQRKLCRVNFTRIDQAFRKYGKDDFKGPADYARDPSNAPKFSFNRFFQSMVNIAEKLEVWGQDGKPALFSNKFFKQTAEKWLDRPFTDGYKWRNTFKNIDDDYKKLNVENLDWFSFVNVFGLTELIWEQLEGYNSSLSALNTFFIIFDLVTEKITNLDEKLIDISELWRRSPNTRLLVKLIQRPEVFESLLFSAYTPKFQRLLDQDRASVSKHLCDFRTNWTHYFADPPNFEIEWPYVRSQFCFIDLVALEKELEDELLIKEIKEELKGRHGGKWKWERLARAVSNISVRIAKWSRTPPKVIDASFLNQAVMAKSFGTFFRANPTAVDIIGMVVRAAEIITFALPEQDDKTVYSSAFVLGQIFDAVAKNINNFSGKRKITLADLFEDEKEIRNLLELSFTFGSDSLMTFLYLTILQPHVLIEVFMKPKEWKQTLCEKYSISDVIAYPKEIDTGEVDRMVCNINTSNIAMEMVDKFNINSILAKLYDIEYGKWNDTRVRWNMLWPEIRNMLGETQRLEEGPAGHFELPKYNRKFLNDQMTRLFSKETFQDVRTWLSLIQSILSITLRDPGTQSNTFRDAENPFRALENGLQAGEIMLDYTAGLLSKLDIKERKMNVGNLFKNDTRIRNFFLTVFQLGPDLVNGILSTQLKIDKIPKFLLLSDVDKVAIVCSEKKMREFFMFDSGFNPSTVVKSLCRWNVTAMFNEILNEFDVNGVVKALMSINETYNGYPLTRMFDKWVAIEEGVEQLLNLSDVLFDNTSMTTFFDFRNFNLEASLLNFISNAPVLDIETIGNILNDMEPVYKEWDVYKESLPYLRAAGIVTDWIVDKSSVWWTPLTVGKMLVNDTEFETFLSTLFAEVPNLVNIILNSKVNLARVYQLATTNDNSFMVWGNWFCDGLFIFPAEVDATAVNDVLCKTNFTAIGLEVLRDMNYDLLAKELNTKYSAYGSTSGKFNWTHTLVQIRTAVNNVYAGTRQYSNVTLRFLPEYFMYRGDWNHYTANISTTITKFISKLGFCDRECLRMAGESMQTLMPVIKNLTDWQDFLAIAKVSQVFLGATSRYLTEASRSGVSLDSVLLDAPKFKKLLRETFKISPQTISLVLTTPTNLFRLAALIVDRSLFCTENIDSFFFLSPETSLASFQSAVCGINETLFLQEFENALSIGEIIKTFQNISEYGPSSVNDVDWPILLTSLYDTLITARNLTIDPPQIDQELIDLFNFTKYQSIFSNFNNNFATSQARMLLEVVKKNQNPEILTENANRVRRALADHPTGKKMVGYMDTLNLVMSLADMRARQMSSTEYTFRDAMQNPDKFEDSVSALVGKQPHLKLLMSSPIRLDQFKPLMESHTPLSFMCGESVDSVLRVAEQDSPSKGSGDAESLQSFVCGLKSLPTMEQTTMFQLNYTRFLRRVINDAPDNADPDDPAAFDWVKLANDSGLMSTIAKFASGGPSVSQGLGQLLDSNQIDGSFSKDALNQNPSGILSKLAQLSPILASMGYTEKKELDSVFNVMEMTSDKMNDQMAILAEHDFRFTELARNPATLNRFLRKAFDDKDESEADKAAAVADIHISEPMLNLISEYEEGRDLVCNMSTLTALFPMGRPLDPSTISALLCKNQNSWYDTLKQVSVPPQDVVSLATKLYEHLMSDLWRGQFPISDTKGKKQSWNELVTNMKQMADVMKTVTKDSRDLELVPGEKQVKNDELTDLWVKSLTRFDFVELITYFRAFDPIFRNMEWWEYVRSYVNTLAVISDSWNTWATKLGISEKKLKVSALFPDQDSVTKILNSVTHPNFAGEFYSGMFDASNLFWLSYESNWKSIACTENTFKKYFVFPAGMNNTAIRLQLCSFLTDSGNDVVVKQLFDHVAVMPLIKEIERQVNFNPLPRTSYALDPFAYYVGIGGEANANFARLFQLGSFQFDSSTGFQDYTRLIANFLKTLADPALNKIGKVCDGMLYDIKDLTTYKQVAPYLVVTEIVMEHIHEQLLALDEIPNLLCDFPNLNLTGIWIRAQNTTIARDIVTLARGNFSERYYTFGQQQKQGNFFCSDFTKALFGFIQDVNYTVRNFDTRFDNWMSCGETAVNHVLGFTGRIDKLLNLFTDIHELFLFTDQVDKSTIDVFPVALFDDAAGIMSKLVVRKSGVYAKTVDILRNASRIEGILKGNFLIPTDIVTSFLQSDINVEYLLETKSNPRKFGTTLCTKPQRIFHVPEYSPRTVKDIQNALCFNADPAETIALLLNNFDYNKAEYMLKQMPASYNVDQAVLNKLSQKAKQPSELDQIAPIIQLIDKFSVKKMRKFGPRIREFLFGEDRPELLAQDFRYFIDGIAELIPKEDEDAHLVLDDLKDASRGLDALETIRVADSLKLPLQMILRDKGAFQTRLNSLGISKDIVGALSTSYVNYINLLLANDGSLLNETAFREIVCNPTELGNLFYFNSSLSDNNATEQTYNVTKISAELCELDVQVFANITMIMFETIDTSKILKQVVLLQSDKFLPVTDGSDLDFSRLVESIQGANVGELVQGFEDIRHAWDNRPTFGSRLGISAAAQSDDSGGSMEDLNSVSSILCGTPWLPPTRRSASSSSGGGDGSGSPASAASGPASAMGGAPPAPGFSVSKVQDDTSEEMKTRFEEDRAMLRSLGKSCEMMLDDILSKPQGFILWMMFKPLMFGKILYAPENLATKLIVKHANKTFDEVTMILRLAESWLRGENDFKQIIANNSEFVVIEKALVNPLVSAYMKEKFDLNANEFLKLWKMSGQLKPEHVNKMTEISRLVHEYSRCFSYDRFLGVEDEAKLVTETQKFSQKQELLASIVFLNVDVDADTEAKIREEVSLVKERVMFSRRVKRSTNNSSMTPENEDIKPFRLNKGAPIPDEAHILDYITAEQYSRIRLPKHVQYKIRMNLDSVETTLRLKDPLWMPGPSNLLGGYNPYFRGFLQIQDIIERAIINIHIRPTVDEKPHVSLLQMPTPCFESDQLYVPGPRESTAISGTWQYFAGYLQIQDIIERAIVKVQAGTDLEIPVSIMQFPSPCFERDPFMQAWGYLKPTLMTLIWVVFMSSMIKQLVLDKEKRLDETMKMMGLKAYINWFAWLLSNLIFQILMIVVMIFMIKMGNILPYSNIVVIFVYMVIFAISAAMMAYMISSFFTHANLGALCGILLYMMSYLPYTIVITLESQLTGWQQLLACFSSTACFSYASLFIARLEQTGIGVKWENVRAQPMAGNEFSVYMCMMMMIVDSVIYFLVGWYVSHVKPGKYGIPKPWYFFVLPSFWGCVSKKKLRKKRYGESRSSSRNSIEIGQEIRFDSSLHEIPTHPIDVGVSIQHLTKRYDNGKLAVNDLSLNFYEGQITSFLGHNGAGKTTTISMLSGMYRPTSGTAKIYGYDLWTEGTLVRRSMGVCPQYDVLFDFMTVMEHLFFYCSLKTGLPESKLVDEVERMLYNTGLHHKRHAQARNLSGGQKRRLSVAIAFIGGSRCVILDEPTSGVDPCARRGIWDVILRHKQDRTIILTTHHLDEADILSERIAIIHSGQLLCSGSSMFLKNQFGSGYHLAVSKLTRNEFDEQAPVKSSDESNKDTSRIMKFIHRFISEARVVEEIGTELTVALPVDRGQTVYFHRLFAELDASLEDLGIRTYGVSDTTLEEVFLRVTSTADQGKALDVEEMKQWIHKRSYGKDEEDVYGNTEPVHLKGSYKHRGYRLKLRQARALIVKRFNHMRRSYAMYLTQMLMPSLLIFLAMICAMIRPRAQQNPPLIMTPAIYEKSNAFFKVENSYFLNRMLGEAIVSKPDLSGPVCAANAINVSRSDFPCDLEKNVQYGAMPYDPRERRCSCGERGRLVCFGQRPEPQHWLTNSSIVLYNLSNFDVTKYLLDTHTDFIEKRYGGLTFGAPESRDPKDQRAIVWYNNKGYHSIPAFMNAMNNVILRAAMQQRKATMLMLNDTNADDISPEDYVISAYNHPLQYGVALNKETLLTKVADTGIALTVLGAFSFVPAGYVIYVINERLTKEKRQQYVYGVGPLLYWCITYAFDMVTTIIPLSLTAAIMAIFQVDIYTYRDNLKATITLLGLHVWAVAPLGYLIGRYFRDTSTCYVILFLMNLFLGVLFTIMMFLFTYFSYIPTMAALKDTLEHWLLISPQYCLGGALLKISQNTILASVFRKFGKEAYVNPFRLAQSGYNMISMAICGAVAFLFVLVVEHNFLRTTSKPVEDADYKEDSDVSYERQRVITGETKSDVLTIYKLSKTFRSGFKKIQAVNNVCVSIPRGECFGLLGVNGAGKTTTFRMITGDTLPSAGAAFVLGKSTTSNLGNMEQEVGYCPQFDALDRLLTAREMLYCYGRIKGIPEEDLPVIAERAMKRFELLPFADRVVDGFSGGTKRKLSTAVALLGDPTVLLMDEPTTGMDPGTRRLVWNNILQVARDNRSVILTTHSMEECDALCTRLAIMVNGQLKCLGSPQHLKTKFGDGYTVMLKLSGHPPNIQKVVDFICTVFPGATVRDQHHNSIQMNIPSAEANLSSIFGHIESEKARMGIDDYSVTQTTLDQVFVNFAQLQTDGIVHDEDDEDEDSIYSWEELDSQIGSVRGLKHAALKIDKSPPSYATYDKAADVEQGLSPVYAQINMKRPPIPRSVSAAQLGSLSGDPFNSRQRPRSNATEFQSTSVPKAGAIPQPPKRNKRSSSEESQRVSIESQHVQRNSSSSNSRPSPRTDNSSTSDMFPRSSTSVPSSSKPS